MADSETLWFQSKLQRTAQAQAELAIEQTGRALPCQVTAVNGSLVTVSFQVNSGYTLPHLTMPCAYSQWARIPIQVNDPGIVISADTSLAGITQGLGVSNLSAEYGNLGSLVFIPVSSKSFPASPNANQTWINGPAGAILSDEAQTASVTVSANLVTIKAGGSTWTFAPGAFTMASGVVAETHLHSGVTGGPSDTGPPVP